MSWLTDVAEHLRPGRALTVLARIPLPVVTPERFARRLPEPGPVTAAPSPLVDAIDPRAPRLQRHGDPRPCLDGDVVIKDQIDVAGLRTGIGLADGGDLASSDAEIVTRIIAAGGRIVGKAKMTELGIDGIGTLMHYPMPRNPRAPGYVPGGSSTGTAVAVATGLARYGVGGDGLGSIRIPAAFCGLVGLRPGRDRSPRQGIRSPVRSLDSVGPIARTVDDCARLWQVMAGDPIEAVTPSTPDRVGVPRVPGPVSRSIGRAFHRVLAALSIEIERIVLPGLEHATFLGGMTGAHELATGPFAARARTRTGRLSVAIGRAFSTGDVERLRRQRDALRAATERVLEHTPILAMPTTAIPPPAVTRALLGGRQDPLMLRALGAFTPLANLVDLPSIAVPCGVDERGRPLSIMFTTVPGGERALLQIALAVERTGLGAAAV